MVLSQRAVSLPKSFHANHKPKFQTKYRQRNGNHSVMTFDHQSNTNFNTQQVQHNNYKGDKSQSLLFNNTDNCPLDDQFRKTSSKLQTINFKHHNPNLCVCAQCVCGRHLCKFHAIKPNLSKNTIYKKDYLKKKPVQNKINISQEYDRFRGPNLDPNSTYYHDFDQKKGEVQKFKPEDLLKNGGPCAQLTSYTSGFPGYRGKNQYVKPTDSHVRGYFPMRSRSTYTKSFTGQPGKRSEWGKVPDNLRTGSNWYGSTTYGNNFRQPNPEDYAHKYSNIEKYNKDPNYNRQYETTYGHSFLGEQPGICPAKVILETKSKGFFSNSKDHFTQNADYKSLDPSFHAISTSKHHFV